MDRYEFSIPGLLIQTHILAASFSGTLKTPGRPRYFLQHIFCNRATIWGTICFYWGKKVLCWVLKKIFPSHAKYLFELLPVSSPPSLSSQSSQVRFTSSFSNHNHHNHDDLSPQSSQSWCFILLPQWNHFFARSSTKENNFSFFFIFIVKKILSSITITSLLLQKNMARLLFFLWWAMEIEQIKNLSFEIPRSRSYFSNH